MNLVRDIVSVVGRALRPARAGTARLVAARLAVRPPRSMRVTSQDFEGEGPLPERCTAGGDNATPSLAWEGVPPIAREMVIVCEDADAPLGRPFVHWIAYRIPPELGELAAGLPAANAVLGGPGIKQGINGRRRIGYDGPAPPRGHGKHRYYFQVFALREPIEFGEPPDREALFERLRDNVVGYGEIVGTYESS
jgi:hypothetical protein